MVFGNYRSQAECKIVFLLDQLYECVFPVGYVQFAKLCFGSAFRLQGRKANLHQAYEEQRACRI